MNKIKPALLVFLAFIIYGLVCGFSKAMEEHDKAYLRSHRYDMP